jgi:hypothetical protein
MRIKFEKGMTPEAIAQMFVELIRGGDIVIGTVNMYVQTFDEEMKPEKFDRSAEYLVCKPTEKTKKKYEEDVARIRRRRMRAIV